MKEGGKHTAAQHTPSKEELLAVLEKGKVCNFQECAHDLCSTYFDERNPSIEGLPPSRLGLGLGREVERKMGRNR